MYLVASPLNTTIYNTYTLFFLLSTFFVIFEAEPQKLQKSQNLWKPLVFTDFSRDFVNLKACGLQIFKILGLINNGRNDFIPARTQLGEEERARICRLRLQIMDLPARRICGSAADLIRDGLVLQAGCPRTEREAEDLLMILCVFAAKPLNTLTKS